MARDRLFSENRDDRVRKMKEDLRDELLEKHRQEFVFISTKEGQNGLRMICVGLLNETEAVKECLEKYRKLGVEVQVERTEKIYAQGQKLS